MTRAIGVVVFTVIEVAALAGWLVLVDRGLAAVGIGVLFVGLVVEHIITDLVIHARRRVNGDKLPILEIVAFSGLETAIWAAWLLLWTFVDPIGATIFLTAALLIEHTVSKSVHERRGLLDRLIDVVTLPHTVVEVIACTAWLLLVRTGQPLIAIAVLLVGSLVEHTIAVSRTRV